MTAEDFLALHPSTQNLIAAGAYHGTWPEAETAFMTALVDQSWIDYMTAYRKGTIFKIH